MGQLSCVVCSATLRGVKAIPVSVEVIITSGIPSFSIVGMPDVAIQESRERVRAAIKASGFSMPSDKIVVNLAPGSLKKRGSGFDLPIALGILVATKQISSIHIENTLVTGELSLVGQARATEGLLAFQYCAKDLGLRLLCGTPEESVVLFSEREFSVIDHLSQARRTELPIATKAHSAWKNTANDFAEVRGHEITKRALQIAVAGNHGVLMVGPPGSGKTMLARCFAGRADGLYEFPARFTLIAATNPCPCGYYGDPDNECHCSELQIRNYQNRIGGPLLDRIDIRVEVWSSSGTELMGRGNALGTHELREGVLSAREFSQWRQSHFFQEKPNSKSQSLLINEETPKNSKASSRTFSSVLESCRFEGTTLEFLTSLIQRQKLNARSVVKTLLVARTVADLDQKERVGIEHLSEAYTLRFQGELLK